MSSSAIGVGALVLETMGGMLADIGWREPFFIHLVGVPILIICLVSIREPEHKVRTAGQVINHADTPHSGRKIATCYAMVFMGMFLMFSLPTNLSAYMTEIGEEFIVCGLLLGLMGVSQAAFSVIYARVVNKPDDMTAFALAFLLMCAGLLMLHSSDLAMMFASMILVGSSLGLITMAVIGRLSLISMSHNSGKIMGGYSVAMNLSFFISALIIAPVVAFTGSYPETFVMLGAVSALVCVMCSVTRICSKVRSHM